MAEVEMTIAEKIERAKADIDEVWNYGYDDGYNYGWDDGWEIGIEESYNEGYEEGKQAEYNAFWDSALSNTNPIGKFAGKCWNNNTFKPNKSIVMEGNMTYAFYCSGIRGSIPKIAKDLGITITMKPTQATGAFHYCSLTEIEIDCVNATNLSSAFGYTTSLETLTLKNVKSACIWTSSFLSCTGLKNLTVTGTIGQNISFADCPLTAESAWNIYNSLKNFSGTSTTRTLTFSKKTKELLDVPRYDEETGDEMDSEWVEMELLAYDMGWELGVAQ